MYKSEAWPRIENIERKEKKAGWKKKEKKRGVGEKRIKEECLA